MSGTASLSATKLSGSPRSFPPNLSPRDMLAWGHFPIKADLEASLGIQVGAGVAPGNPRGDGAAPRSPQIGSVGDVWPRGGVGLCPSCSERGEDAGCFTDWKQDGKISSREIRRLHLRSPAERSPPCGW